MESRFSRPTKFELPNYIIPFTNPLGTNASMVQPSVGMFVLGFTLTSFISMGWYHEFCIRMAFLLVYNRYCEQIVES